MDALVDGVMIDGEELSGAQEAALDAILSLEDIRDMMPGQESLADRVSNEPDRIMKLEPAILEDLPGITGAKLVSRGIEMEECCMNEVWLTEHAQDCHILKPLSSFMKLTPNISGIHSLGVSVL